MCHPRRLLNSLRYAAKVPETERFAGVSMGPYRFASYSTRIMVGTGFIERSASMATSRGYSNLGNIEVTSTVRPMQSKRLSCERGITI
jgi:hypothetical protein